MNKIIGVLLALIIIGISFLFYFHFFKSPKIAYVRSQDLIYKYSGTIEAKNIYNNKKEKWQANLDTLENEFQQMVSKYNSDFTSLSPDARKDREKRLQIQQEQLSQYRKSLEERARAADEEMMQGVLNQVNAFVENYGKINNYDIILGTTTSGNVLYGNSALDITDELLQQMNDNYNGANK